MLLIGQPSAGRAVAHGPGVRAAGLVGAFAGFENGGHNAAFCSRRATGERRWTCMDPHLFVGIKSMCCVASGSWSDLAARLEPCLDVLAAEAQGAADLERGDAERLVVSEDPARRH